MAATFSGSNAVEICTCGPVQTKVHSNYPRNKDEMGAGGDSRCVMYSISKARLRRIRNVRDKCLRAEGSHL